MEAETETPGATEEVRAVEVGDLSPSEFDDLRRQLKNHNERLTLVESVLSEEPEEPEDEPSTEGDELTPKQQGRLSAFKESFAVCKVEREDEQADSWVGCLSRELKVRGQRL